MFKVGMRVILDKNTTHRPSNWSVAYRKVNRGVKAVYEITSVPRPTIYPNGDVREPSYLTAELITKRGHKGGYPFRLHLNDLVLCDFVGMELEDFL